MQIVQEHLIKYVDKEPHSKHTGLRSVRFSIDLMDTLQIIIEKAS